MPRLASLAIALVAVFGVATATAGAQTPQRTVLEADVTGPVTPAMAALVATAIDQAAERGADALVLRLDTPGGLDGSMREIVREVLAAPVPVVVHVAPDGARAASAGLFITLAGHVAAMAPQSNIGSATPVSIGPGADDEILGRKVRNDAGAYAVALAEGRGRNGGLARRMVADALNVTATEAREQRLVDALAPDTRGLLAAIDGMTLRGPAPVETLDVGGASVERLDPPLGVRVQQVLLDPNLAFLLLVGGVLAIGLELLSPGLVGPGLFGAVSLLLGLYGTAQLPVAAAGALLLAVGAGFLVAETQVASGGLLGVAGALGLTAGGLLLFDGDVDALRVSVPVAIAVGGGAAAFVLFAASRVIAARAAPPRGGAEDLVGRVGTVRAALAPVGRVQLEGASWRARSEGAGAAIPPGRRVRVERVDGLTVTVRPVVPAADPDDEGDPSP